MAESFSDESLHVIYFQVYSAFLDTLTDFMVIHKADLNEWLFILLTRLIHKLGSELLASVHSKVVRVLDVVRLVITVA